MNKKNRPMFVDITFLGLLFCVFVGMLFFAVDTANLAINSVILCIVFVFIMLTYFTTLRVGLVIIVIFEFLLLGFTIFKSISTGISISWSIYFWMIWPVFMVVTVAMHVKQSVILGEENRLMQSQLQKLVTIDEVTHMNNLLAFQKDAKVYMNISRRYHMDLSLVLWKLTYEADIKDLIGKKDFGEAISAISDGINGSLRGEDLVYVLDNKPYLWGVLLFTKPESSHIVIEHVKKGVEAVDLTQFTHQRDLPLELTTAVVHYNKEEMSPLSFLTKAKETL